MGARAHDADEAHRGGEETASEDSYLLLKAIRVNATGRCPGLPFMFNMLFIFGQSK